MVRIRLRLWCLERVRMNWLKRLVFMFVGIRRGRRMGVVRVVWVVVVVILALLAVVLHIF